MKISKNNDIRQAAKDAGVYLWEVAQNYGLTDANFSRLLRNELAAEKKNRILAIISELQRKGA